MNIANSVENKVLQVLRDSPETRDNDMLLILRYYNRFGNIRVGALSLKDIVYNYKSYGLPCFESIRRARQRVQSLFPELRRYKCEVGNGGINIVININQGGTD